MSKWRPQEKFHGNKYTAAMKIYHLLAFLQVNEAVRVTEKFRLTGLNGCIGHAVLDFGGTTLMLAEEFP